MNTSRYLQDQREALRASVEYFRSGNAIERNLWVGREFLQNLNLSFVEGEVMAPPSDPPDLIFRDFHAEVKEILDPGRKRHAEYKEALLKAERARDPQELLKDFSPKHLLPSELVNLVESRMPSMSDKYVRAFRATTDLLIYVNLLEHLPCPGAWPNCERLSEFSWRSVSAVFGWGSYVFVAKSTAPQFLIDKVGSVTLRKSA